MEDSTKAYEFKYIITQLTESPFTKAIIAEDEGEAMAEWERWTKAQAFEIQYISHKQVTDE